jgi:hypothetical protein
MLEVVERTRHGVPQTSATVAANTGVPLAEFLVIANVDKVLIIGL